MGVIFQLKIQPLEILQGEGEGEVDEYFIPFRCC